MTRTIDPPAAVDLFELLFAPLFVGQIRDEKRHVGLRDAEVVDGKIEEALVTAILELFGEGLGGV
jgi:hypothetical protein